MQVASLLRREPPGGQHEHRDRPRVRVGMQRLEDGEAVEHRHDEVEDDDVGPGRRDRGKRLLAVCRLAELDAVALERRHHEPSNAGVVVDDEHGATVRGK